MWLKLFLSGPICLPRVTAPPLCVPQGLLALPLAVCFCFLSACACFPCAGGIQLGGVLAAGHRLAVCVPGADAWQHVAGAAVHCGVTPSHGAWPAADVQVWRWWEQRREQLRVWTCSDSAAPTFAFAFTAGFSCTCEACCANKGHARVLAAGGCQLLAKCYAARVSPYLSPSPAPHPFPNVRLLHQYGSAPNPLLYIAYFLPTSITTAWLSVASAVQLLIAAQGPAQGADLGLAAALLAAAVTAGGEGQKRFFPLSLSLLLELLGRAAPVSPK